GQQRLDDGRELPGVSAQAMHEIDEWPVTPPVSVHQPTVPTNREMLGTCREIRVVDRRWRRQPKPGRFGEPGSETRCQVLEATEDCASCCNLNTTDRAFLPAELCHSGVSSGRNLVSGLARAGYQAVEGA